MAKKPSKSGKTRQISPAKEIRNAEILAKAAAGAKGKELAEEFKLSRHTISEILNSKDAKDRAEKIMKQFEAAIPAAMKTVFDTIKLGDYAAAKDLLQSFGAMNSKKGIEVTLPPADPGTKSTLTISMEERVALLKDEG